MPLFLADQANAATLTNVATATTSTPLLASNNARKGALIVNESTAIMYLAYDVTASATHYSVLLAGSASGVASYWELPAGADYLGPMSAIWSAANGSCRITEY